MKTCASVSMAPGLIVGLSSLNVDLAAMAGVATMHATLNARTSMRTGSSLVCGPAGCCGG